MLAKPGPLPQRGDYAFEFKWDGYRTLLLCEGGKVRVQSRSLRDVTAEYPELQAVGRALGKRRAVLDGEIVVLDAKGRPSFDLLQRRAGFRTSERLDVAVTFLAFDLAWLDGRSLLQEPYAERRALLEGLGSGAQGLWVPPSSLDGPELRDASQALGLEGLLAKRRDSRYEAGLRTGAWVKVKNHRQQEFVVGGFTRGEGSRRRLGALVLGYYEGEALRYAGRVGTGFTDGALRTLAHALEPLAREASPFEGEVEEEEQVVFVEPRLVCEVRFASWTLDGHVRHATYRGLRADKDAREVVREEVL